MQQILWHEIEKNFAHRQLVTGGFSMAERGVVTLSTGQKVFAKIGSDEWSKQAINREIIIYQLLNRIKFPYAPQLLTHKDGALAIEDLSAFDFSHSWSEKKLAATLRTMDALTHCEHPPDLLTRDKQENGWRTVSLNPDILKVLKKRSTDLILQNLDIADAFQFADIVEGLPDKNAALVHMDVRGDNVAYDMHRDHAYLVDWNWLGMMNRGIDSMGLLTSVQRSGFDVEKNFGHMIDPEAALFMAGFWLSAASRPIWEGGDASLRDIQLESALICLRWWYERGV